MMKFNQTQETINRMTIGQWWQLCDAIDEWQKAQKKAADEAKRSRGRRR